ncbi:MAG TPA: hypothetical protein VLU25_07030 [Acidobacteriota bacterium]|nr:hypothetical protein [Acidobacteriota bacterium]
MNRWKLWAALLLIASLCTLYATASAAPLSPAPPAQCLGGLFGDDDVNKLCVFASAMLLGAAMAASGGTAGLLAVLIAPKAAAACVAAAAL